METSDVLPAHGSVAHVTARTCNWHLKGGGGEQSGGTDMRVSQLSYIVGHPAGVTEDRLVGTPSPYLCSRHCEGRS